MTASSHRPSRLRDLAQAAIAASTALTSACAAGQALSDAQYAGIDHAAAAARQALRQCLRQDHGIDGPMADQLGAVL